MKVAFHFVAGSKPKSILNAPQKPRYVLGSEAVSSGIAILSEVA
jgi:hypothetical protein